MESIRRCSSSTAKASSRAALAWSASFSGKTKQIEDSLEAWLIIATECPACESASKVRAAIPGTPIIPFPSTDTKA